MSEWDNTRILIVGGAGFVGSNLARRLLNERVREIIIVDNLLSSEPENIPQDDRIVFWQGSIADDDILKNIEDEYEYIFHLATYHGNQSSIHNPLADHENNLITTLKLFYWVRDFQRLEKVVYSGAGCAVAEKTYETAQPTRENDPISLDMDSPYSISKMVGEFYAVYFHKQHELPTVRARFQNVYGPGEVLGAGQWRGTPATVWRNVTPTFIYKALKGQELPLENGGIASRDFIYVEDIVEGLMLCALRGASGDVYNLASGIEITIKELAELINRLTKNKSPLKNLPRRDWDRSGRRFGSTEKSRQELGFDAKMSLEKGLEKTVEWTEEHLDFIEKTMRKHEHFVSLS
jgi:nucleoside-diphosphate-sugar epimerase